MNKKILAMFSIQGKSFSVLLFKKEPIVHSFLTLAVAIWASLEIIATARVDISVKVNRQLSLRRLQILGQSLTMGLLV